MTIALCLNCGGTKFGAFLPCNSCTAPATGNHSIDILFTDHQIAPADLKQLGNVIRLIGIKSDDPEIRFWTFISYISRHHSQLLSADVPEDIRESVELVLTSVELPTFEVRLKEPDENSSAPPSKMIECPRHLFEGYVAANRFYAIAAVQVRDRDGRIHSASLMDDQGPLIVCREDSTLTTESIVAIREAPGCLIGWVFKPKWIK